MKTTMLPPTKSSMEAVLVGSPNPEVNPKPDRRRFAAEYKRKIVREADACTQAGEVGAMLRREGLYSSHLTGWRQSLRQAEKIAFSDKKRGPKIKITPKDEELAGLRRENGHLKEELRKAKVIIDIQKKLSGLLGFSLNPKESEGTK